MKVGPWELECLSRVSRSCDTFVTMSVCRPLVVFGPSGVGKGTLLTRLFSDFPDKFGFSVSRASLLFFLCPASPSLGRYDPTPPSW